MGVGQPSAWKYVRADGCKFYDAEANKGENDDYVEAFIDGAQRVWSEVVDKL